MRTFQSIEEAKAAFKVWSGDNDDFMPVWVNPWDGDCDFNDFEPKFYWDGKRRVYRKNVSEVYYECKISRIKRSRRWLENATYIVEAIEIPFSVVRICEHCGKIGSQRHIHYWVNLFEYRYGVHFDPDKILCMGCMNKFSSLKRKLVQHDETRRLINRIKTQISSSRKVISNG